MKRYQYPIFENTTNNENVILKRGSKFILPSKTNFYVEISILHKIDVKWGIKEDKRDFISKGYKHGDFLLEKLYHSPKWKDAMF